MRKPNDRLSIRKLDLDNLFKDVRSNEQEIERAKKFLTDTKPHRDMKFFTPEVLIEIARRLSDKNILAGKGILKWNNYRRKKDGGKWTKNS